MSQTALILIDMQIDFLNKKGAYSRAGVTSENLAKLPGQLAPVVNKYRDTGSWIISTHFTLVPGKGGEPLISEHLKKLRPFLAKGDFVSGSFGHGLIDELGPSDVVVEKIAYSAFYMTRLFVQITSFFRLVDFFRVVDFFQITKLFPDFTISSNM